MHGKTDSSDKRQKQIERHTERQMDRVMSDGRHEWNTRQHNKHITEQNTLPVRGGKQKGWNRWIEAVKMKRAWNTVEWRNRWERTKGWQRDGAKEGRRAEGKSKPQTESGNYPCLILLTWHGPRLGGREGGRQTWCKTNWETCRKEV